MLKSVEKIITPEKVILKDGRKGYFIDVPITAGTVLMIKYPLGSYKKRSPKKTILAKQQTTSSTISKSILIALKEVKSRKVRGNYPKKDFDTIMDEL